MLKNTLYFFLNTGQIIVWERMNKKLKIDQSKEIGIALIISKHFSSIVSGRERLCRRPTKQKRWTFLNTIIFTKKFREIEFMKFFREFWMTTNIVSSWKIPPLSCLVHCRLYTHIFEIILAEIFWPKISENCDLDLILMNPRTDL